MYKKMESSIRFFSVRISAFKLKVRVCVYGTGLYQDVSFCKKLIFPLLLSLYLLWVDVNYMYLISASRKTKATFANSSIFMVLVF